MPDPSAPIRALIVDDHRLFNDGLNAMLVSEPGIKVVGQLYHSKDAPHAVARLQPDVLLMDFNMPGINGLEMTRQLLAQHPALPILILSMYSEKRYVDDFQKAGARGYVLKTADVDELVAAIQSVVAGKLYFDGPSLNHRAVDNHADDGFARQYKLTPRELDIIQHIRQGLTSQQIADLMHVSTFTVETHRRNIYLKLDVSSVAALLRFMDEHGT